MEMMGVDLDMDLLNKINEEITEDLKKNKQIVLDSLLKTSEAKEWVVANAMEKYPISHKGNWAIRLIKDIHYQYLKVKKVVSIL